MIDMIYNCRQADLTVATASADWNSLCMRLENTMNVEQVEMLHDLLDIQSAVTAEKVRSSYKEGFKDGVRLMQGVQNYS